jgi:formylmethanofuran dehydrogenase subunit E
MEFIVRCGRCGETATFKDGDNKKQGEIDFQTTWDDVGIEIWCDKCNEYITLP